MSSHARQPYHEGYENARTAYKNSFNNLKYKELVEEASGAWYEKLPTKFFNLFTGKGFHGLSGTQIDRTHLELAHKFKLERGDLWSNIKEFGASVVRLVNPEYKAIASAKGLDLKEVGASRASSVERAASWGFSKMAKNPKTALAVGALSALGYMHSNHSDNAKLRELEAFGQQTPMPEKISYKNSVTPKEWALTESQFRSSDSSDINFANRLKLERANAAIATGNSDKD